MPLDPAIARRCNFFLNAPDWVMREQAGKTVAVRLPGVPDDGNLYWVGGTVIAKSGIQVPAVFTTTGRGELHASFWRVGTEWFASDDPALPVALGSDRRELWPFDYRFNVPVERDTYHSPSSN
jgi:hypothetical protein